MTLKRSIIVALLAVLMLSTAASNAFADSIGYIDFDKVYSGYAKAKNVQADFKVKEAELQKMRADFIRQIEESKRTNEKNPVKTTTLEKRLLTQLKSQAQTYQDWFLTQQKQIRERLETVVKQTATKRNIDVVLSSRVVLEGGIDITNDVLSALNSGK